MYKKKRTCIIYFVLFFTLPGYSQIEHSKVKPNSIITIGGNKITFGKSIPFSIEGVTLDLFPSPEYLGNKKIYRVDNIAVSKAPGLLNSSLPFPKFIFKKLQSEFDKLENGTYAFSLEDLVIDEKGQVVFYDYSPLRKLSNAKEISSPANFRKIKIDPNRSLKDEDTHIPKEIANAMLSRLSEIVFNCKFSPALLANGKATSCDLTSFEYSFDGFIEVKDHLA
ncbi:MAG: hypothetical protein ACTHJ0_10885, partial [Flavipsychrobacter sp.]